MNAHQDAQGGRQAPSPAGVASVPTVDAAAVLDGGGGHFPARHYATGELLTYCDRCDCAWRGDEQTGGCETVLLARRVIALEAALAKWERGANPPFVPGAARPVGEE
jgi:hypothetical protein